MRGVKYIIALLLMQRNCSCQQGPENVRKCLWRSMVFLCPPSHPSALMPRVQWCDLMTGWGTATCSRGRQGSRHSPRALGVRMAPTEVAVEWQRATGTGRGFGVWKDALEGAEGVAGGKQNFFFKIIWGLASDPRLGPWNAQGSPCTMTTNPEQQLARCVSSSRFVVRCCHCYWPPGQRRTFPLSRAFCTCHCCNHARPFTTRGTSTKCAFSLWNKPSSSGALHELDHGPLLWDRSSLKECKETSTVLSDFVRIQELFS